MLQLPVWILTLVMAGLSLLVPPGKTPHARDAGAGSAGGHRSGEQGLSAKAALGQMIIARFAGDDPSAAFLDRIKAGEIGGVILFAENLEGSHRSIRDRVDRLRRAAAAGANPPLLVMVDQEGGKVRRLDGPPTTSPARMSGRRDAREQGEATAALLSDLGIDVDLAPVADVGRRASFLGPRAFGSSPEQVALRACAFAEGLRHGGVVATLKHFPGLGLAGKSTDADAVTITAPAAQIRADYAPYQTCAGAPMTMVMVGSAVYPLLTGNLPAVMERGTYTRELALAGAAGAVTISDAFETPAIEPHPHPARKAIAAGLDLLLYAKSESTSAAAYRQLRTDLNHGRIPTARVREAADAILTLKGEIRRGNITRVDLPPASG